MLALLVLLGVLVPIPALADVPDDALEGPTERTDASFDAWHEATASAEGDAFAWSAPGRAETFVALAAFTSEVGPRREVGVMAHVGIAFDRIAAYAGAPTGSAPVARASPILAAALEAPPQDHAATRTLRLPVTREVARRLVAAAWRAAGLGVDDANIDAIVSRARWSALLPETRVRAMRRLDDRVEDTGGASAYAPYQQNSWLEARLTFRLDRLLYAGDEPSLERVRIERIEARARLAGRVLEELARWQRAWVDLREASIDTAEGLDASLRMADAESALDVLTAGWFGAWRAREKE